MLRLLVLDSCFCYGICELREFEEWDEGGEGGNLTVTGRA